MDGRTVERVNPPGLPPPVGFSHVVVASGGRLAFLAGQCAQEPGGAIAGGTLAEQFDLALANVVAALEAVGSSPPHVVKMTVYCTDPAAYAAASEALGASWRARMGRVYPAMTLVGVTRLFDPAALVELDAIALVP